MEFSIYYLAITIIGIIIIIAVLLVGPFALAKFLGMG